MEGQGSSLPMRRVGLGKLPTFEELRIVNKDLEDINETLIKTLKQDKKPDSIAGRVIVDTIGLLALYFLLFVVCDFTRAIILGTDYFGLRWMIFGPYYYITKAPFMTRIWKSKKFLEDLSQLKRDQIEWPVNDSCSGYGDDYIRDCNSVKDSGHHPIRDNLGKGLDWILSHLLGGHLGKLLTNSTCEEQGNTLARECANSRINAIWHCYNFFCDQYSDLITHRAEDINWPNTAANSSGSFNNWSSSDRAAYNAYYNCYICIYDIGSTLFGGHGTPSNLNPAVDTVNYYSLNPDTLWQSFNRPNWFTNEAFIPYTHGEMSRQDYMRYFQLHYQEHLLDYWD